MKNIQSINIILIIILFSIGSNSFCQSIEDTKYQIVSSVIDTIISKLDFDYFYEHQALNEPMKLDEEKIELEKDTMIFVDPITYESDTITNRQSARKHNLEFFPKRIREYKIEKELWDNVKDLNKKVIFINSFSKNDLRNSDLKRLSEYKNLLNKLHNSDSVSWNVSKFIKNDILQFEPMNSSKRFFYKYATVAFITISEVILNKERTKAVLQIGVHYCINRKRGDGGISGFGSIICLKKNGNSWFRDKGQRLWEE
jgi:hypothetical protein